RRSKSGGSKSRPSGSKPRPGGPKSKPNGSKAKPDESKPESDAAKPEPAAAETEPDAAKAKPDAPETEPDAPKATTKPSELGKLLRDRLKRVDEIYTEIKTMYDGAIVRQFTLLRPELRALGEEMPNPDVKPKPDEPTEEWFGQTLSRGEHWHTKIDPETGESRVMAMRVVQNDADKILGLTGIEVNVNEMIKLVTVPAPWRAHTSTILLDPKPCLEGKAPRVLHVQRPNETRTLAGEPRFANPAAETKHQAQMIARLKTQTPGVFETHIYGERMLVGYSGWDDDGLVALVALPWDIVAAESLAAAEHIRDRMVTGLHALSIILLVVALAAVLLARRIAKRIAHPIGQLADSARCLADGDFSSRVQIRTRDELEHLGEVFNSIGPRLAEHRDLKRSLEVAREIQQHLLPLSQPRFDTVEIYGMAHYCDETGGDYIDYLPLDDDAGSIGIACGDITGHGVGAALLMASARAILRSHARHNIHDLPRLFELLNRQLIRDTGDERFLTLLYAVLEPATREISVVSGGHETLLWVHAATGEVEEIESTGPLLGVIEGITHTAAGPFTLAPGDVMLISSDGLREAANPEGEMFNTTRTIDALKAAANEPTAEAIHDHILATLRRFCHEAPFLDDVALIVLKAK
ncbi:MAG: SpoIIE family protein phosphatase, partial [Phycisphaerales bacterium]|nr:SpoIIE family protein phosphatase [Phycisphaerales bacterium]